MHIWGGLRKVFGYLVTQLGIKTDVDQISTVLNIKSPTYVKEVQILNGRLTALNWFISWSIDKCRPFFYALKKNRTDFHWNREHETTLQGLKRYLTLPPLLSKPSSGDVISLVNNSIFLFFQVFIFLIYLIFIIII